MTYAIRRIVTPHAFVATLIRTIAVVIFFTPDCTLS